MSGIGFETQRERLLNAYKAAGKTFLCNTRPYHSTAAIVLDVVDANETAGIAYAVARAGTRLTFFDYGIGEEVDLGGSVGGVRATLAETNQAEGGTTNGSMDFVIEGVGLSCRGMRVEYDGTNEGYWDALVTDADVLAAVTGDRTIYDPAPIISPPQMQSPFNLENGMFQSLLGQASLSFLFDRQRVEEIGTLEMLPQAGAASYLRANGAPEAQNKYRIPEGYLWRRAGQPDNNLNVNVQIQRAVVMPINLPTVYAGSAEGQYVAPERIVLEIVMRVFGLGVDLPSQN